MVGDAPPQLVDRLVLVGVHPGDQLVEQRTGALGAPAQELGGAHHDVCAGQQPLGQVGTGGHPRCQGERGGWQQRTEDRDPAQGQPHLARVRQLQARRHVERLEIEVRLVEAVEEDEAVSTRLDDGRREVRERGEVRRHLHCDRHAHGGAHRPDEVEVALLDVGGGSGRVDGHVVHVQLDGPGARVLEDAGVLHPAASRVAVDAGDDRHGEPLRRLLDEQDVAVEAEVVEVEVGEVVGRLARHPCAGLEPLVERARLRLDLLLEEAGQHHGAHARVVEAQEGVELPGRR